MSRWKKNDGLFIPEAAALRALVNFLKYPDKASGLFVDFYARGLYTKVVFERAWTLSAMGGRRYDVKRRKEVEPPAAALVDFQIPVQTAQAMGFEWGSPLNQLYRARHIWDLLMLLETEREWPDGTLTDEPGLSLRFLEALQTGTIQMWAQRDRGEEWERWTRLGEGFVFTQTDILLLPEGFSPPPADPYEPWAGLEAAQARAEEFVRALVPEGKQGPTPVVIGGGLEEQHPELRALRRLKNFQAVFAEGMTPDQVAIELITRFDARNAVLAGLEEETALYASALEGAGISVQKVAPAKAGQLLLAILARAAGMEEAALAARDGVGRFLDDLDALGRGA